MDRLLGLNKTKPQVNLPSLPFIQRSPRNILLFFGGGGQEDGDPGERGREMHGKGGEGVESEIPKVAGSEENRKNCTTSRIVV